MPRNIGLVGIAVLVLLVVAGASPAYAATEAQESQYQGTVNFGTDGFEIVQGETVEIPLRFEDGADRARIAIESDKRVGYSMEASITAQSDEVTLVYDTYVTAEGGNEEDLLRVKSGNAQVEVDSETKSDSREPLVPHTYDVWVAADEDPVENADDLASLEVRELVMNGASVTATPGQELEDADDPSGINEGSAGGDAVVAEEDGLIIRMDTSAVHLLDRYAGGDEEAFYAAVQDELLRFGVEESGRYGSRVVDVESSGFDVHTDRENDRIYVSALADEIVFEDGSGPAFDGERLVATVGIRDETVLYPDGGGPDGGVEAEYQDELSIEVVSRSTELENTDEFSPDSNVRLAGETTAAPGTDLTVVLRASRSSASASFLREYETPVSNDGSFAVTADLSDLEDGDTFSIEIQHPRGENYETVGEIDVPSPPQFTVADLDAPSSVTTDELADVTVTTRIVNEGEQAGGQSVRLNVNGETIAERETELSPGDDVAFEFSELGLDAAPGEVLEVSVATEDDSRSAAIEVVTPEGTFESSLAVEDQTGDGGAAVVTEATADRPFVLEVRSDDTVLASEEYDAGTALDDQRLALDPQLGSETELTIALLVDGEEATTESIRYSLEDDADGEGEEEQQNESQSGNQSDDEDDDPEDDGLPLPGFGFTPGLLAILSVVGAALLRR